MKMNAYSANRRRNRWRDNSLERADENTSGKFDWYIIRKFRPYVGRYKGWTLASVLLMLSYTVFNLANPYLIGVAIDQFIGHNDWRGLAIIGTILIVVNVLMWQVQYWQVWTKQPAGFGLSVHRFQSWGSQTLQHKHGVSVHGSLSRP